MRFIVPFLMMVLAGPALAQTESPPDDSAPTTSAESVEGDSAETLEPLGLEPGETGLDLSGLDAIYDNYFDRDGPLSYTGAAVSVVKNGETVLLKGYGFADAARTTPVDPETTPFAVGSVTKTWVGVLLAQLVAEGVVGLDDPVNDHLTRTQIPDNQGVPITLRHLATHQAGFADDHQPFMGPGDPVHETDAAYIQSVTPGFIRPVSSGPVYSNYGIGLLGWVLEDVTGSDFNTLLQDRVFDPVGIQTGRIIEGPDDRQDTAQGELFYPNGGRRAVPTVWANNHTNKTAGGGAISAGDMARYMTGLMDGTILSPAMEEIAFSRQGETHPLLQGYGSVFMINDWNGNPIAEHGGRTLAATSYVTLIPEEDVGIFVSVTGEGGTILPAPGLLKKPAPPTPSEDAKLPVRQAQLSTIRALALEHVLGRYEAPVPTDTIDLELSDYVGSYSSERRPERTPLAAFRRIFLGGAPLQVSATNDGGLRFGYYGVFDPIAPDLFYKRDAREGKGASGWSDLLAFRRAPDGSIMDASTTYTDSVFARQSSTSDLGWTLLKWGGLICLLTGLLALIWPRKWGGRWAAVLIPPGLILLPILFFRSWPSSSAEALSYLLLSKGDLWLFRGVGTALALAALWIAFNAVRHPETVKGWRAHFAVWHRRLLGLAGVMLAAGLTVFGVAF